MPPLEQLTFFLPFRTRIVKMDTYYFRGIGKTSEGEVEIPYAKSI